MPGQQRLEAAARQALRPLVHAEVGADAVAGAMVVVEAVAPERRARHRVDVAARRARAASAAGTWRSCPFSTSVNGRIAAGGTGPIATVRVMSVVPSAYCAPLSMSRSSPGATWRLEASLTR